MASATHKAVASSTRVWHTIDAEGKVVGKLAQHVAKLLQGKNKPFYTPAADCGDHVVILNADKVRFTGRKATDKVYYWHTGYPGGLKHRTAAEVMERAPERVIRDAIRGMLPKTRLAKGKMLRRLRVTAGEANRWESQCKASMKVAPKYIEACKPPASVELVDGSAEGGEENVVPFLQERISAADPSGIDIETLASETVDEPDFELLQKVFASMWEKEVQFWADRHQEVPEDMYERHGLPYPGKGKPPLSPEEAGASVAEQARSYWEETGRVDQEKALANLKQFKETDGGKWMDKERS